jgi:hypothetical protein
MLELRGKRMVGTFQGRQVRLEISDGNLTGLASGEGMQERRGLPGTIEVDIFDGKEGGLEISGLWCGKRVHIEVTSEFLRGTIAGPGHSQCQYVLDRTERETGARLGTSICYGMPQETRLEVPAVLGQVLRRGEMVAVLLVVLSS